MKALKGNLLLCVRFPAQFYATLKDKKCAGNMPVIKVHITRYREYMYIVYLINNVVSAKVLPESYGI